MMLYMLCSIFLMSIFMMIQTPLFMTLMIIMQSITLSIVLFKTTAISWFSYIFLMVFLSGMMVLFAYVSSLASNQIFKLTLTNTIFVMATLTMTTLFLTHHKKLNMKYTWLLNNTNMLDSKNLNMQMYSMYLEMSHPFNIITLFLIMLLLIALFVVIKNSKNNKHPLRSI